jgi:predicted kinase
MLIGIPGSGKTHWININKNDLDRLNYEIITPDKIRQELTGDISDLSHDKIVWNVAKVRVSNALLNRRNVILDATNVNYYYRKQFIENLPNCVLKAKLFEITPEVAKERIKKDIKNGISRSNVPEDVIERMHNQFTNFCCDKTLIKEGFEIIDGV